MNVLEEEEDDDDDVRRRRRRNPETCGICEPHPIKNIAGRIV